MHRPVLPVTILTLALVAGGCSAGDNQPTDLGRTITVPAYSLGNSGKAQKNFVAAPLKGAEEIPAVDSDGTGSATFQVSKDGLSMTYKLQVANLDDVVQSHIHVAPPGSNGPVVLFLFGPVAGGTSVDGRTSEGTATAANLVGPLAGHPLSDLLAAMEAGNTYVNVHTVAHPPGEIRDQIR
jgi:hypothetical protein